MVTVEGVCSGMRRDCWWNPLPNRLRLLFRGRGEGCTVVHVGRDVTGGS